MHEVTVDKDVVDVNGFFRKKKCDDFWVKNELKMKFFKFFQKSFCEIFPVFLHEMTVA